MDFIFSQFDQFYAVLTSSLQNPSPLLGAATLFLYIFTHGGWIVFVIILFAALKFWWLNRIQTQYAQKRQWTMLAIDVPRDNEQTPKAVENIFAHLAGAHSNPDYLDTYWKGASQDYFSFEIVGIEGFVQFVIRTPTKFRDLVEAAIYSQYPEAQITEIEDYTTGFPTSFPDERYDMYGTEFVLVADQAYPIKTYPDFEHVMSQEFKDPLTVLMETLNKLGPGEQVWLQLIIVPTDEKWKKPASVLIKKIMAQKNDAGGGGIFSALTKEIGNLASEAQRQALATPEGSATSSKPQQQMMMLPPDEASRADGISRKIKKIGFLTKFRLVYVAQKEHFTPAHGSSAIIGAIKQFNTGDLNALKPDTKHVGVHAHYILIDYRKNLKKTALMAHYKSRSHYGGRATYILNTEELATIWHFPIKTELVPVRHMVQRTEFKHTPPPPRLPYATQRLAPKEKAESSTQTQNEPPSNLPLT